MHDPEGRRTVADLVQGVGVRVVPVGRLDYHTSGVLLLSNDGDFSAALGHPRKGAAKVYVAKLRGVVDEAGLGRLGSSIEIDGRTSAPADVHILRVEGDKTWVEMTLVEGRNRQVRRLGDESGHSVLRLVRTSFAGITAEGLRPGEWRYLTVDELTRLKQELGVPQKIRGALIEPGVFGRAELRPRPEGPEPGERRAKRASEASRAQRVRGAGGTEAPIVIEGAEGRSPRTRENGGARRPAADPRRPAPSRQGRPLSRDERPAPRRPGSAAAPTGARPRSAPSVKRRTPGPSSGRGRR